jgi:general secretion pathway protein G
LNIYERLKNRKGFTLIELMIVMSIIGILAAIAVPNYRWGIIKAKEAVLKEELHTWATVIDQFYADHGKWPDGPEELISKKYLRDIPKDPITNQREWNYLPPPSDEGETVKGNLYEARSTSDLIGSDGRPYSEWRAGD